MGNMFKRVVLSVAFLVVSVAANAQCAMCKAVAESNSGAGGGIASGLNEGILYLMAFPYIMMAIVATLWYRHNKKTKAKAKHV